MVFVELWVVVLIVSLCLGTTRGLYRKYLADNYETETIMAVVYPIELLLLTPVAFWILSTSRNVNLSLAVYASAIISAIASFLFLYSTFKAYEEGDISIVKPLLQLTPIFTAVVEPFFLPAEFNWLVLISAILAVTGSFIVITNPLDISYNNISKRMMLFIVLALASSLGNVLSDKFGAISTNPILFLYISSIVLTTISVAFAMRRGYFDPSKYKDEKLLGLGVITVSTSGSIIILYSLISAAKVGIFSQLTLITTVVIGGFILDKTERLELTRRIIGAVLIVSGSVIIYIIT